MKGGGKNPKFANILENPNNDPNNLMNLQKVSSIYFLNYLLIMYEGKTTENRVYQ